MGMIKPYYRTSIIRSRTCPFRYFPHISKPATGRYRIAVMAIFSIVFIIYCAFRSLLIKNAMRVHVVGSGGVILKYNMKHIAYFCPENWSQQAQVLLIRLSWFQFGEGGVCIFPVYSFYIHFADPGWSPLSEQFSHSFNRLTRH